MIDREEQVAQFLPILQRAEAVGLDTEADSLHAYPEKLCLLQVSVPGADVLIDPLAGCNLEPLVGLFQSKPLILHGADYDLRLLHRAYQFVPETVFDTMWAARLLGYREFGLRDLVLRHLGITLEKGPQKMNWALRPLPERMLAYALNDTRYLRPLAAILQAQLEERGRLGWHAEVCANLIKACSKPAFRDPEELWRVKGSDRLDGAGRAVLRELWRWREEEALAANKPPYFVLSHENLVALSAAAARGGPAQHLVPSHVHPRRAARLAQAVQRGLKVAIADHPRPRRPSGHRMTREELARFDQLKRTRDARAHELGLDPTLIASKAELALLANDWTTHQWDLMSWQRSLLGTRTI
jgi:ribonuclease D